ncbi:MAG: peptide chain release factor aRF-1 [Candidatus Korarchaeota archaeon]|nr:peptide chain release factor aRF-1 [Candidatus Korarchaeota archaeon]
MSLTYERYEFKKLIKELKDKRGRGTELISLYIPPGRNVYDVIKYLRDEYDQASNIKDKLTRKNVQSAIESIIQRLKLYRKVPEHGLVVFCGAIPQGKDRGTEKIEIYVIEPPEPVRSFQYICDHEFYVEPLEEMAKEKKAYGLIVMDRGGGVIAVLRGPNYKIVDWVTSDIPPKHSAGGQSQRRFERIREERVHDFFKRLGKRANEALLPLEDELEGIIIGGPGDAREKFEEGNFLDYRLQKKVIANIPLSYTEEQGVRELVMKAEDLLKESSLYKEKALVEEVFRLLAKEPGKVAYGISEVERALEAGAAEKVLVLEDIPVKKVKIRCSQCGYEEQRIIRKDREASLSGWQCPNCGGTVYEVEEVDIIEHLGEMGKQSGAEIYVISSGTEWGTQLKALGGVAAVLRYELREY